MTEASTPRHPEVLWAQRSSDTRPEMNVVFLTVNVPDVQEDTLKVELTGTTLTFSATAGDPGKNIAVSDYAFSLEFHDRIVPDLSTRKISSRSVYFVLRKAEERLEYWPRLQKNKESNSYIKTDFSKWVDQGKVEGEGTDDDMDPMAGIGLAGEGIPPLGGTGGPDHL
ncbi:p23/wos2 family protein [Streptomyces sp. NBC_00690]|uniref:p23/wos2 family protein n=1 Tax=Streptomyces sp. NBC_00690 TaxID=2975808 RepID=UPI002E2C3319|nr:p23/wos2 family protein [Streptomyces sp. NBC_00690]